MQALTKTLKVRIKDKHSKVLIEWAKAVNFSWNYINELSSRSIREKGKFLSAFDIHPYTTGAAKELGLHSHTLQCVAKEYVTRRKQFKKARLNWRKSHGAKRSLGWVPVNTGMAAYKSGQVYHNGQYFGVWDSFGLGNYKFRTASFNEDSRGRWYFNVAVEIPELIGPLLPSSVASIGVDLGLKTCATASDGQKIVGRFYRALECKLGVAQRANKKSRTKAIHAKISNQRKNMMHQFSTALVRNNAAIFVGNVSSSGLIKTKKMAKSTQDASWSSLKTMLEYKSHQAGIVFEEVNEAFTTQTCSCCRSNPASSPKGRSGLGIREWTCSVCGSVHDRDVNAARNILALGHERLAGGIPVLTAQAAASS